MTQYRVQLVMTVSTSVPVVTKNAEAAIDAAFESDKMPGSMTYGAFGDASVDEAGEWLPVAVTTVTDGKMVWQQEGDEAGVPEGHTLVRLPAPTVETETSARWSAPRGYADVEAFIDDDGHPRVESREQSPIDHAADVEQDALRRLAAARWALDRADLTGAERQDQEVERCGEAGLDGREYCDTEVVDGVCPDHGEVGPPVEQQGQEADRG